MSSGTEWRVEPTGVERGVPKSAGAHPPVTAPAGRSSGGWVLALAVLVVGMFMSVLDISIVNVALPSVQRDLGASVQDIQWVSTAYSLALGVIVPVSSWLGDRFGLGRVYVISLLGFAAGSVMCGLAWDLPSLVVFRVVQAIPGGILPVISLTMVYRVVPKDRMGSAMAMYGIGVIVAPAIGPTLGGYLVEYQNWRWIFLINLPIGLVGAVLGLVVLRGFPSMPVGRFDRWGFLTVSGSLFALLLAFSKGQDWGWDSYPVLLLIVFGLLGLALFVMVELHVAEPLLDVRVFRLWQFDNSLLLVIVLVLGMFAMLFYVPLFLQEQLGVSPLYAGLLMLPEAVAMGAMLPVAGVLYELVGARVPAVVGLAIAAYGTYLLCGISADLTPEQVVIWTWVRGIGNGLAMMPIMTAGLAMVPDSKLGEASALNNVAQRVSSALGLAVFSALAAGQQAQLMLERSGLLGAADPTSPAMQRVLGAGPAGLLPFYLRTRAGVLASAYSDVFLVVAVMTAVGAVLALMLKVPKGGGGESGLPMRVGH